MRRALALALAWLGATALAQGAPPSIEDFQRPPAFSGPVLSPDGRHVAAIMALPGNRNSLVVIPTDAPTEATGIKAFGDVDMRSVTWLSDDRLAITVQPKNEPFGRGAFPGLWTIGRDGRHLRQWADSLGLGRDPRTPKGSRMLSGLWSSRPCPTTAPTRSSWPMPTGACA